ncbi:MAG: AAA family ATPase [Hyphomonadaceae bacterium]
MSFAAFLCFAPEDAPAAEEARATLAAEGLTAALSPHLADLGGLPQQTAQTLGQARCLVLFVSEHTAGSEAARREAAYAMANGKQIATVRLSNAPPGGWAAGLIGGQSGIDASGGLGPQARAGLIEAVRRANATGPVIAMLNIKGGVGKTVLAANLFAAAHMLNHRSIVFVDLDPQHNLTQYFLSAAETNRLREANQTIYSVLAAQGPHAAPLERFADLPTPLNRSHGQRGGRLDLVLGDERLFEHTLDMTSGREKEEAFARFHALIALLRERYHAVVIDTNPCASFLTRLAVTACDHVVAPVRPEKYSLTGLNLLEHVTRMIRQRPLRPEEFSVLLNGVGERARIAGGDIDALTREEIASAPFFGGALLPIAIPFTTMLRAMPGERFAPNPINTTAIMRFSQRALKETLTDAAALILARAQSQEASGHAPNFARRA